MWAFVTCLQNEEVHFRQQALKVLMGTQKMKTLALQAKIKTLAKRFEDDEIDRTEHLEGLWLVKSELNHFSSYQMNSHLYCTYFFVQYENYFDLLDV